MDFREGVDFLCTSVGYFASTSSHRTHLSSKIKIQSISHHPSHLISDNLTVLQETMESDHLTSTCSKLFRLLYLRARTLAHTLKRAFICLNWESLTAMLVVADEIPGTPSLI
eukprot:TRINITY_DN18528_c0_g1_i1.p2 TRINITY_DN18528_c0_g1~~TRINITY_DN18528_c0_g1_i1.p2  ORF type:complete len:112 (-),score=12.01 TRINITY_DN18528_c0_g1_i1:119-454(-)